jgi:hypothetical protein
MPCLAPSPFWNGLGGVSRSFLAQNPHPSLALGEILNPAQRIRVEGFDHMTTAGARQSDASLHGSFFQFRKK